MTRIDRRTKAGRELEDWRPVFLEAFAACGTVTHAAEQAGISRRAVHVALEVDKDFAAAFEDAKEQAVDTLHQEAVRRARDGVEDLVVSKGQVVMIGATDDDPGEPLVRRVYSDMLLLALLKAHRPREFRERVDLSHSGQVATQQDLASMSDDELRELRDQIATKRQT